MKTYEELTKKEKETFRDFSILAGFESLHRIIILSATIIIYSIGIALAVFPYKPINYAGIYLLSFSMILTIVVLFLQERNKKKYKLIFGKERPGDMFDIKKEDIKSMKKVWEKGD